MADLSILSDSKGQLVQHAIFFHGLGGDPVETWRSPDDIKASWITWLAEDIEGLAVWTVGYEAAVSRWRGSAMHLTDRASNILERILIEPKLKNGEITLIGHSLGGLVIKSLLRSAESMKYGRSEVEHFINRIRRVGFIATPHFGAGLATFGDRARILLLPSEATASLVRNDPYLKDLNLWYRDWSDANSIEHLILTETQLTHKLFFIVKPDSSDPGLSARPIPIDADHCSICKPHDRSSEIYLHLQEFLRRQPKGSNAQSHIEEKIDQHTVMLETIIEKGAENKEEIISALDGLLTIQAVNRP